MSLVKSWLRARKDKTPHSLHNLWPPPPLKHHMLSLKHEREQSDGKWSFNLAGPHIPLKHHLLSFKHSAFYLTVKFGSTVKIPFFWNTITQRCNVPTLQHTEWRGQTNVGVANITSLGELPPKKISVLSSNKQQLPVKMIGKLWVPDSFMIGQLLSSWTCSKNLTR